MFFDKCKKNDFKPFFRISDNHFELRWGKEDVVVKEGKVNETTKKWELTGKVKPTEYCTYETMNFIGNVPNVSMLSYRFNMSERVPSMSELNSICKALGMKDEEMVPLMREQLKRAIKKYDKKRGADGVENFTINGINVWLTKDERTGLLLRFQAEKAAGKTETTLWKNGMSFTLKIDDAINMLYALEVYASETYDMTAIHDAEADKIDSIAGFLAYDETRKTGYPAQLAF